MRRRVGQGSCPERGAYGGSALQGVCLKTIFECPLIGNGDSVIITNERHKAELLYARRVEPRVYRPLPCAQRMAGGFLFNRKLRSLLNKNAPRGSHCGGKENVAFATRRRRRILRSRILFYRESSVRLFLKQKGLADTHWGRRNRLPASGCSGVS